MLNHVHSVSVSCHDSNPSVNPSYDTNLYDDSTSAVGTDRLISIEKLYNLKYYKIHIHYSLLKQFNKYKSIL